MLKKIFKKKSRVDILDEKISSLLNEILIHDFTNAEIALILKLLSEQGKKVLESRKEALEQELTLTINALNQL